MKGFNFNPFPVLETERLSLRHLRSDDDNEIFFLRSDERVLKYLVAPKANNIEDARAFIRKIIDNDCVYWGICLKDQPQLIGTICFWNIAKGNKKAEIGYVMHPDFQGKGLMWGAISKVILYGFEQMKLHIIEAILDPENSRSVKLLEKNNFVYDRLEEKAAVYVLKNPLPK
ncbi:GNAT family N-acetyltransferase [Terrimonas pollutisoli]|uniref:GNAT family N-acetyltransferase n=1 Tax=Terrimonas pollutisoli TaxID=3034147 RepID=UPI0023EA9150|nr:GNAT family N-acetyltransferase [Terrimonas sp. H1YJ31]